MIRVLRIAVPDVGKPLSYKDGEALKGMDVDLANAVADTLGLKAEIGPIPPLPSGDGTAPGCILRRPHPLAAADTTTRRLDADHPR
ncbi:transporter substrate-binding domain-containing protein [Shinella pollutisoli]|uniref:Transporter substrate-binding domain-containing protein n=1 Tax=Shinella pollutisoli TaxID=2250594 RepID=A0ABV7DHB7_9HYPH|nr:transporter substrate-binding domain-containing protein [Shinella pollutisoli]